ncbi:MAG: hypothetical protein D6737_04060 [Chloroflexi bacterium]|nr:MAG: hypothetical protein D6737_04060 [Chloroflexota bacterium]
MARVAQFGIALGALGIMLTLMGLFPGMTGIQPTLGFGVLQIVTILTGLGFLLLGAIIYVKFTFYVAQPSNLAQQIGLRLAFTGYIFSSLAGLADVLGFGSHTAGEVILLGPLQASGIIGGFVVSSLGILLYAVSGDAADADDDAA